jgi:hypothetical protein
MSGLLQNLLDTCTVHYTAFFIAVLEEVRNKGSFLRMLLPCELKVKYSWKISQKSGCCVLVVFMIVQ